MKNLILVLERWEQDGYVHRLVTDGHSIWQDLKPKYGKRVVVTSEVNDVPPLFSSRPTLVLEQWKKSGYQNRLVTDGYSIWLEYLPKYAYGESDSYWRRETVAPDFWLKDFSHK